LLVAPDALREKHVREPRSILITGASSGIGAALAFAYAAPGIRLVLGGRDLTRLKAAAASCKARGAAVAWRSVDVIDAAAMETWIAEADEAQPLDLVIANAGIAHGLAEAVEDADPLRRMVEVNLVGTLNTMMPALQRMRTRGRGQIALVSSLAALRGVPGAHGYCTTKAAIKVLGESLRAPLAAEGIALNVVLPGFVRTPMNEGANFPTPLRVEPDRAAVIIRRGLGRNRALIVFPRTLYWGMRLFALWPTLADALAIRIARQAAARGENAKPPVTP
jgi:NADP-dependent 3-hydroxy acid dehydrogenase YdfG